MIPMTILHVPIQGFARDIDRPIAPCEKCICIERQCGPDWLVISLSRLGCIPRPGLGSFVLHPGLLLDPKYRTTEKFRREIDQFLGGSGFDWKRSVRAKLMAISELDSAGWPQFWLASQFAVAQDGRLTLVAFWR